MSTGLCLNKILYRVDQVHEVGIAATSDDDDGGERVRHQRDGRGHKHKPLDLRQPLRPDKTR
jgi:hypothetical protein